MFFVIFNTYLFLSIHWQFKRIGADGL